MRDIKICPICGEVYYEDECPKEHTQFETKSSEEEEVVNEEGI